MALLLEVLLTLSSLFWGFLRFRFVDTPKNHGYFYKIIKNIMCLNQLFTSFVTEINAKTKVINMEWIHKLEALPEGLHSFEEAKESAAWAAYSVQQLDGQNGAIYRYIPSTVFSDDPNKVHFSISKTIRSGRSESVIADVIAKAEQIRKGVINEFEIECTQERLAYIRNKLYAYSQDFSIVCHDGVYKVVRRAERRSKYEQLADTLVRQTDGQPITMGMVDLQGTRNLVSRYNREHSSKWSVGQRADGSVYIYKKEPTKVNEVPAIVAAASALRNGDITLAHYDAAIEQWNQLKKDMDDRLRQEIWKRMDEYML